MEASGAGLAGSGDGPAQGEGQGEGESNGQAFDASAFSQQLEGTSNAVEEMRQFLMSEPWSPQEEAAQEQPAEQEFDLSFLGDEDTGMDPAQVAQQLTNLVDQKAQEKVGPLQEQLTKMQAAQEAKELVGKYPELNEIETAQKVADHARYLAEEIGRPELADNMRFIELTYLSARATDAANQEGTEPSAAHLEGAGGAGPAGGQQVDLGDLIANAGNQNGRLGARVLDGL